MTQEYPLTPVGLEAQSRAAIKAWRDDPSVQLDYCHQTYRDWRAFINSSVFDLRNYYYRIAKPRKWYRVGKISDYLVTVTTEEDKKYWESHEEFIEWIDKERKYYD